MENVKSGSEHPKGDGRSLSLLPGLNQDITPSGASSPIFSVSYQMQFGNFTLQSSGEAAVAVFGSGRSLGSSPRNRPLEKADKDGRVYLGGLVVDGI